MKTQFEIWSFIPLPANSFIVFTNKKNPGWLNPGVVKLLINLFTGNSVVLISV